MHLGIVLTGLGLGAMGSPPASDHPSPPSMVPSALVVGVGAGTVSGQLFDVTLGGVAEAEVGTASGILNALQQLAFSLVIAAVATILFDVLDAPHLASAALAVTALASLAPLAVSFAPAFRLPERTREPYS